MVFKLLLLLPLLPGVLTEGVVKTLGVLIADDEIPVHTWFQLDPTPSKLVLVYKLECTIPKTAKDMFVVKIYYQEKILDILTVTRFDDELLKSITVLRRDKEDRHRIRYKMTKDNGAPCKMRLYTANKHKGFSNTEADCRSGFLGKLWTREGKGWKWDADALTEAPPRGVVGQIGMLQHKETGELLHSWNHKLKEYKMAVRRVKNVVGDTYLATITYRGAVLDVVEVHSLGEDLTWSVTIVGPEKGAHVIQYQKTDDHCQRLNYKVGIGEKTHRPPKRFVPRSIKRTPANSWKTENTAETNTGLVGTVGIVKRVTDRLEYKDVTQPPKPLRCRTPIFKAFSSVFKKLFMVNDSGNGWIW